MPPSLIPYEQIFRDGFYEATPFSCFLPVLQDGYVSSQNKETVFSLVVPEGYVGGVITEIGNTYPSATDKDGKPLFTLNFKVDDELVESVQRIIADINAPKQFNPLGIAVKKTVEWIAVNKHMTAAAHTKILCNGFFYRFVETKP